MASVRSRVSVALAVMTAAFAVATANVGPAAPDVPLADLGVERVVPAAPSTPTGRTSPRVAAGTTELAVPATDAAPTSSGAAATSAAPPAPAVGDTTTTTAVPAVPDPTGTAPAAAATGAAGSVAATVDGAFTLQPVPFATDGGGGEGSPGLYVMAKTAFTPWTRADHWAWMNGNYDAMIVWEPWFDEHLPRYQRGVVYKDSYAIKVDTAKDPRSIDHPDWILRDAAGNPAYIPFACDDGCPQYAADIGNPAFRADWIAEVQANVDKGYRGLYIDDVNYLWRLSDARGGDITPIDPRTGLPLTLSDWQRYMTEFLEEIRATFPQLQIWHNSIWYADSPSFDNPLIDRQIRAADVIQLERGVNDRGLTGGTGTFGLQTFFSFVDRIHANGAQVAILDENAVDDAGQWYNVAGVLLINDGGDLVTTEDWELISPTGLFPGYLTDLGDALGPRRVVGTTLQREFTGGLVVLNEPDAATVTVDVGGPWATPDGTTVTSVTLGPRQAVVLTRI